MFRFTKYKPSVLKTLEQTCSETHFRIKASNLSQTIFKDLSVLADRKKIFPPMGCSHPWLFNKHNFFNVTIVCSTNSRAPAIFFIYDFFFHFGQGQLPAAPTLLPIFWWSCRQFFFLQPIFAQFFQNWRKSANWLTICTPDDSFRTNPR